jgi:hypothetical protein
VHHKIVVSAALGGTGSFILWVNRPAAKAIVRVNGTQRDLAGADCSSTVADGGLER